MNNGPTLHSGPYGDDVRRLQRLVMMKSVQDFQSGAGLTVDGIAGPPEQPSPPPDPLRRSQARLRDVCDTDHLLLEPHSSQSA